MKNTLRIVIISSLVNLNIVIWYDIFGDIFLRLALITILVVLFVDYNAK